MYGVGLSGSHEADYKKYPRLGKPNKFTDKVWSVYELGERTGTMRAFKVVKEFITYEEALNLVQDLKGLNSQPTKLYNQGRVAQIMKAMQTSTATASEIAVNFGVSRHSVAQING